MDIIKLILLFIIFVTSSSIGYIISNQYKNRVNELKELKNTLNIMETKMKYTYETIPEIFEDIVKNCEENISNIYKYTLININERNLSLGKSWKESINNSKTNLTNEDKQILISLEKLLGKTDLDGQVGEIELVSNFLNGQIEKAEKEKAKNEKLYRTLGNVIGLTIVVLLA